MTAATAYNVIQALPKEELPKLYTMLGIEIPTKHQEQKNRKREKVISKASVEEMLRATIFNLKKS